MAQCSATSKRSGQPCQKHAAPGRAVCHMHGGKSLAGIASPAWTDGAHSRYLLPERLRARYQAAVDDPTLLEQRHEVSLLDARLSDLLARVDSGESGAIWRALDAQRLALLVAQQLGHTVDQIAATSAILDLIAQGHADYAAWREIGATLEQRRRLVESERKRLVEMQQVMTSEQVLILMNALLLAVRANVHEQAALIAIQQTFLTLTSGTNHGIDVSRTP